MLVTVGVLLSIIFHILSEGFSVISWDFLTDEPVDMGSGGGILFSIIGTLYLIAVALAFAVPIGVLAAIYLAEYTKNSPLIGIIRYATETLAGIPSIIFGLFGFAFFVIFLGFRWSILSGGLTLAIMILPTIIRTTEESIMSVPQIYREGSLALGATKWQTTYKIVIPASMPGIITGIILGIGRAIGETAAILLTAGSSLNIPTSLFDPARSLSVHLFIMASEGISFKNAYGTATVLIILILAINFSANFLMGRMFSKNNS